MHHNGTKHYNQYTIHCDGPTRKFPGIWKVISATLSVLTFPNLTRSMKILPFSGDSPSTAPDSYGTRHKGKNAAHEVIFFKPCHVSCEGKLEVWD